MIQKILVALDGSESANDALNSAFEIAGKFSAEILLVTVVPKILFPYISVPGAPPPALTNLSEDLKGSHEKILRVASDMIKNKNPNLKVTARIMEGHAGEKIVELAEEEKVDLVVVGSRGLSGLKRVILGSVSQHVAHHCECPVLIVK